MGSSRQKTYKVLFGILSVLIVVYGFTKILPMISGPKIFVEGLKNGENHGPIAFISGKTTGAKELWLNDNQIALDEEGNFSDTLLLSSGYNIILINARDGFGRERTKTFEITATDFNFVDPTPENTLTEKEDEIKTEEDIVETDTELATEIGAIEDEKLLN